MSRSHFRKIFRDITSRKGRTLLATLSIFVGVLGVMTLFSVNDIVGSQIREDIQAQYWPSQILYTVLPVTAEVDNQNILDSLEALPEITNAEGRLSQPVYWRTEGDEFFFDGVLEAQFNAIEDAELTPLTLVDGVFPVTGQNQIAVEQRFADQHEVNIGDEIILRVLGGEVHLLKKYGQSVRLSFKPILILR